MPDNTALATDIQAELCLLSTAEGGRRDPLIPGYRGQLYYDGYDWDPGWAGFVFPVPAVYPGGRTLILLQFMSPEVHFGRLFPGKEFLVRDGLRTVGRGRVTMLLGLERNARTQWPHRRSEWRSLTEWLRYERGDRVRLSFKQVEILLGMPLPPAAWQQPSWWPNDDRHHLEPLAWLEAGWRLTSVDLSAAQVSFARAGEGEPTEAVPP